MIKLYIVRHGSTNWNDKGMLQGLSDIPINETGIKQVSITKDKLKNINFDICISSPLKRAIDTAKIIVGNKCGIVVDDLLIERTLGEFEGCTYLEYKNFNFWDYELNSNYNGVEPVKNLLSRAKIFLDKIKDNYNNKTILIVSHAATIRAIHYNIVGYNKDTKFLSFSPKNGEVYEYEIGSDISD